jgi:hypothetical protein
VDVTGQDIRTIGMHISTKVVPQVKSFMDCIVFTIMEKRIVCLNINVAV